MKLKSYNELTLPKQWGGAKSQQPRVNFSKAGTIVFNPAACTLLAFNKDCKISFCQDEDEPDNWYFYQDAAGFQLRMPENKKDGGFNHSVMVNTIVSYFKLDAGVSQSFLIAGQPTVVKGDKTQYWGIIKPVQIK